MGMTLHPLKGPPMRPNRSTLLVTAAGTVLVLLSGCSSTNTASHAAKTSSPHSSYAAHSPSTAMPSHSPTASAAPTQSGSSQSSSSAQTAIKIENFMFQVPASVPAGAKITVTNDDSVAHTVTASGNGGFNVNVPADGTATFTAPKKPGRYPFFCSIHTNMQATLVVK
jgi:plastocyanin